MLPALLASGSRGEAVARTRQCAHLLREIDVAKSEARELLLGRIEVPDDYSSAMRITGLYALTRYPFAAGVRRWESEAVAAFASKTDSNNVGGCMIKLEFKAPSQASRPPANVRII